MAARSLGESAAIRLWPWQLRHRRFCNAFSETSTALTCAAPMATAITHITARRNRRALSVMTFKPTWAKAAFVPAKTPLIALQKGFTAGFSQLGQLEGSV